MTKVEEVGVKVLKCECKILCFFAILSLVKKENQNTHALILVSISVTEEF